MNKQDFVNLVNVSGGTIKESRKVVGWMFNAIQSCLDNGEDVRIQDVCTISVIKKKARRGRNPQTGEAINIPAKKTLKIKVHPEMLRRLN
ncbi:HU family DNA-binding protein [Patescibacteria group bacterium]|nr:HU family DNA-binding protein [Patescibacteria group bacterium]